MNQQRPLTTIKSGCIILPLEPSAGKGAFGCYFLNAAFGFTAIKDDTSCFPAISLDGLEEREVFRFRWLTPTGSIKGFRKMSAQLLPCIGKPFLFCLDFIILVPHLFSNHRFSCFRYYLLKLLTCPQFVPWIFIPEHSLEKPDSGLVPQKIKNIEKT